MKTAELERFFDRFPTDEEVVEQILGVPDHYSMVAFGVSGKTIAATSTLATLLGLQCPSNQAVTVDELDVGFDGTNSANGPGIIDMAQCTFATNAPGTNSTSVTPCLSDKGRPETIQSVAGKNWTSQPTVITIWKSFLVPTYMGSSLAPLPLLKPMILKGGGGLSVAATLPASVTANLTGTVLATE